MTDALQLVLERVAAAGVDLRETGESRWRGDCVACGGSDRMTVRVDLNGRPWIDCWSAACAADDRLHALNLRAEDLNGKREPVAGRVTFATEVRAEPVRWLLPGRVPLGAVSLLAGDPKLGKSTLSCLFAAGVTLGKFELDPATVLIVSAEDSFTRVIKPRAHVAGADLGRVGLFEVEDVDGLRYPDLPEDVDALRVAIAEHRAKLVIVDPLNAFLSGAIDSWKDHGIRRALAPLARIAGELDCAVLVIVHLNKQRGGDPLYRIGGSIGQVGAARSVLSFGRDPEDPLGERGQQRLLGHLASNWGMLQPTQLFELETVDVVIDDELIETSRLIYLGDTDQSAGDAFGGRAREDRADDCEDAIAELLSDGEPHPSRAIKTAVMKELDISEATVKRAAKRMKDRGELLVHEHGSSSGRGQVRHATEWQLLERLTPIAVREPFERNPATEPKTSSDHSRTAHESNGEPFVSRSSEPFENGAGHSSDAELLREELRRIEANPPPPDDPEWLTW
jgi:AAA domain